jgi:hypothetical protein
MALNAELKQALEEMDVGLARKLWHYVAPKMPQPENDYQARIVMHLARTKADSLEFRFRAWSHAWLVERGLESLLPDELRPPAERLYPRAEHAVGVAVRAMSEARAPLARRVELAMSDAVADCYANGDTEPSLVKKRMLEARRKAYRDF